jgi:hypothetical protein
MSLHDSENRRSPPACDQLPFVSRLAVDNPAGLRGEPWAAHLQACDVCRREAAEHGRTLAVFRAVERERLAGEQSALTWETLVVRIEQEQAEAEGHQRFRSRWGIPAVAVAAGALAVSLAIGLDGLQEGGEPAPARIVRVQPHEQRSMEQVVRWAVESAEPGSDPLLAASRDRVQAESTQVDWEAARAPEGRELAASVPPQLDSVPDPGGRFQGQERLVSAPIMASSPFERRQFVPRTQPASNRFDRAQPLFRLEQRLMPVQPVSFTGHD